MSNGLINRQYVGARYVPKIMGEWNKALQYEALSVVTYMGNSFTSKVPVPANIDISNNDYWVNTGNYNAQIEEYEKNVQVLSRNVQTLSSDVTNLTTNVNILKNKKIIFVGDSFIANYDNSWATYAKKYLNVDGYIWGVGGSGFAVKNYQWIDIMKNRENLVDNKEEITDIIFGSGGNDNSYSQIDIYNAMLDIKNYINSTYPNAKISVCFLGWTGIQRNRLIYTDGRNNYIMNCNKLGFRYLKGCEWVLHNYKYLKDNTTVNENDYLHPNDEGCLQLGLAVTEAYLNGCVDIYYEENIMLNKGSDLSVLEGGTYFKIILHNETIEIENFGYMNMVIPKSLNYASTINIGTFETSNLYRNEIPLTFVGNINDNPTGTNHTSLILGRLKCISENTFTVDYRGQNTNGPSSLLMGTTHITLNTMNN